MHFHERLYQYGVTAFLPLGVRILHLRLEALYGRRSPITRSLMILNAAPLARLVVHNTVGMVRTGEENSPWRWWRWPSLLWRVGQGCVRCVRACWTTPLARVVAQFPNEDVCAICLDPESTDFLVSPTFCDHVFHGPCLERWVRTSPFQGCPCCRTPF